ncbi:MAG TPA: pyrroline-5-carboxylate reductase, partial [Actinomycetales bacterium]|nr:pyrroline-5-carboxylate reductase [Actinomycetales bacterium]
VRRLEAGGLRSAVADAVEAAATRSRQLAAASERADGDDDEDDV